MSGCWKHRGRLTSMVVAAEEGVATGEEASAGRLFAAGQEAAAGKSAVVMEAGWPLGFHPGTISTKYRTRY